MEEPDIHLHPGLQKEFVKFLHTETNNNYLITTHSPAMLNVPIDQKEKGLGVQVFYISIHDNQTTGNPVYKSSESRLLLEELGINGSDVIQPNCLLWVEGPSDRVFIKHWIRLIDPTLQEGKHFSIIFYGGIGNIRNMTVDAEPGLDSSLLDILQINPHAIFYADSDKQEENSEINPRLLKIAGLVESSGGIAWISHGRSIENYLPSVVVIPVFKSLCQIKKKIKPFEIGKFDDFGDKTNDEMQKYVDHPKKYNNDKVGFSVQIIHKFKKTHMDGDLKEIVESIAEKIRYWN
jgi:hypothetical protein